MRAVQRLKGLGWLFSCVVVVLGCYMVSLSVANERNKLGRMNLKIAQAERDLRALGTEFDTRANMVQLERWNGEVLALTAPTAAQFVRDEVQFASLIRTPNVAAPEVKMASLVVPAGVTPIQTANAAAVAVVAATPKPAPAVAKVAVIEEAPAPVVAPVRTVAAVTKAKRVAMLDRQLLSDSTLGDIMSGARAEARRSR